MGQHQGLGRGVEKVRTKAGPSSCGWSSEKAQQGKESALDGPCLVGPSALAGSGRQQCPLPLPSSPQFSHKSKKEAHPSKHGQNKTHNNQTNNTCSVPLCLPLTPAPTNSYTARRLQYTYRHPADRSDAKPDFAPVKLSTLGSLNLPF